MPEAVAANNSLSNPPANELVDSGIQQAENAVPQGAVPPVQNTESNNAEGGSLDAPPAAGVDTADGKKTPWFQRRIDQLTAEKWEERREKENLRRQTEGLLLQLAEVRKTGVIPPQQPAANNGAAAVTPAIDPSTGQPVAAPAVQQQPPSQPAQPAVTEVEINARAERRAQQIANEKAFTKACNDVYSNGKDDYNDFDQSLKTFQMLGGIPSTLLEIVTEMPNAHKILYKLGKDLDLAERVVKMTPTRMAMELARVEAAVAKPVETLVSKAPNPIKPVDGSSRAEDDPEQMDTETWIKWRETQLSSRRK